MRYALIKDGEIVGYESHAEELALRLIRKDRSDNPVLRPVVREKPTIVPRGFRLDGPTVVIEPTRVLEVFKAVPLTAAELNAEAAGAIDAIGDALLVMILDLHNRVSALEGKPKITLAEFKAKWKGT